MGFGDWLKDAADDLWEAGKASVVEPVKFGADFAGDVGKTAWGLTEALTQTSVNQRRDDSNKIDLGLKGGKRVSEATAPNTALGSVLKTIDDTGKGIAVAGGTDINFVSEWARTRDLGQASQVFSDDWQPFSAASKQTGEQAYAQLMAPHLAGAPVEQIQAELDDNPLLKVQANIAHVVLGAVWDPTIFAGKGVALARNARRLTNAETGTVTWHRANKVNPDDISAMLNSTRWNTQINPAISRVMRENPDAPAAAVARRFFTDDTAGYRLSELVAVDDELLRTNILRAVNGDQGAWEAVKKADILKADEIQSLREDTAAMKYVTLPAARRNRDNLRAQLRRAENNINEATDPNVLAARVGQARTKLATAEAKAESVSEDLARKTFDIDDLAKGIEQNTKRIEQLGLQRSRVRNLDTSVDAKLALQEMPLFSAREAAKFNNSTVLKRLAQHLPEFVTESRFSTPLVFQGAKAKMPGRDLDTHDLDSPVTVRNWLDSLGTPHAETDVLVQRYLDAQGVGAKKQAWYEIEEQGITSLFNRYALATGKRPLTEKELETKFVEVRTSRALANGQPPTYGPQEVVDYDEMGNPILGEVIQRTVVKNGTMAVVPNLDTQTPAVIPLVSPLLLRRSAGLVYRSRVSAPSQRVLNVVDGWSMLWRPMTLARVNYMIRNPLEEVFRTYAAGSREGVDTAKLSKSRRTAVKQTVKSSGSALKDVVTREGLTATEKIARNAGVLATGKVTLKMGDNSFMASLAGDKADDIALTKISAKDRNDPFGILIAEMETDAAVKARKQLGTGYRNSDGFESVMHPGKDDPTEYLNAWTYAINRQIKQSTMGNRVIASLRTIDAQIGDKATAGTAARVSQIATAQKLLDTEIRKLAYWLQNTPEGEAVSRRIGIVEGDHTAQARTVFAMVDATVPAKVRALKGKVDEKTLAAHLDAAPATINGYGLDIVLAETSPMRALNNVVAKAIYHPSAHLQDGLARIPYARAVFENRAQQLADMVANAKMGQHVDTRHLIAEDYAMERGIPFAADSSVTPIGFYNGLVETPLGVVPVMSRRGARDTHATVGLVKGAKIVNVDRDASAPLVARARVLLMPVNADLAKTLPLLNDVTEKTGVTIRQLDDMMRAALTETDAGAAKWTDIFHSTLREEGVDAVVSKTSASIINPENARLVDAPTSYQPDSLRGFRVADGRGRVTPEEQRQIEKQARHAAIASVRRNFYDSSRINVLSAYLRHISPFIGAQVDAAKFWGKAAVDAPHVPAALFNLYNAPNRAGLVVDSQGNQIDPGEAVEGGARILMPAPIAKIWSAATNAAPGINVGPVGYSMSQASTNMVFSADFGMSAPFQVPLVLLTRSNPDLADDLAPLFPYGMPASITESLFPANIVKLQKALTGGPDDPRLSMLAARYMQAQWVLKEQGQREDYPTAEEALEAAKDTLLVDFVTAVIGPTIGTASTQSPFLPIIMDYRKALSSYDNDPTSLGQKSDGSYLTPQEWLIEEHGDVMSALTVGYTKNNAGVDANSEAMQRAEKYKDLIDKNPDFAELFIGPTSGYDQSVYTAQMMVGMRRILSPEEYETKLQVNAGWEKFSEFKEMYDLKLRQLGLPNDRVKKAEGLRAAKKQFVDAMREENLAWWKAYQPDYDKWVLFHDAAIDAIKDKRLQTRPDIVALTDYFYQRALLTSAMAKRGRGYSTLEAKGNGDLRDAWYGVVNRLKDLYPEFGGLYSRWLENDPLSVGS